ncbi:hypothetical protein [Pseudomonas sp. MPR-ANC1]|uniref:hypothetical protein n=1 Tax=Pseudomonas sp. MPR-ANC1 TaxID=2075548 RepID=UPI001304BEDA|nr:hypothetical protein [Pseudomonas sp. MPR-ANC1]
MRGHPCASVAPEDIAYTRERMHRAGDGPIFNGRFLRVERGNEQSGEHQTCQ